MSLEKSDTPANSKRRVFLGALLVTIWAIVHDITHAQWPTRGPNRSKLSLLPYNRIIELSDAGEELLIAKPLNR